MRKRKAERVLSDTVGYYHRSKLCCLGIVHNVKRKRPDSASSNGQMLATSLYVFCNSVWLTFLRYYTVSRCSAYKYTWLFVHHIILTKSCFLLILQTISCEQTASGGRLDSTNTSGNWSIIIRLID